MKVFKTCLLIARNSLGMLIGFVIVFILINVLTSQAQGESMEAAFQGEPVPYTIVNRDTESPLVTGLRDYLATQAPEAELQDDLYTLQDALYYGETSYIIIIPQGFTENWPELSVQVSTRPDSMQSYVMDLMLESYFSQVKLQMSLRPAEPEAAVAAALESLNQEAVVETASFDGFQPMTEGCAVYFRLAAYGLMMLIYQFISSVQMVFGRKEIRMRHGSSPLSQKRLTLEIVFYGALMSLGVTAILMGIALAMHGDYFAAGGWQLGALVYGNMLAFMLVAVGLAIFCSQFTHNQQTQSIISNFVTLSLSFLGGLFVPLELLSESLLKVGRLLPTYWYVDTFNKINELTSYSAEALRPVWQGILLLLGYAVTFFCLSLLISKYRRNEN